MKVLICGAGVIGVTSAWQLAQAGHQVTVVERLDAPAEETSFANGGQISVGHTEPWAQPDLLPKIVRWLGDADAPIRFHPRLDFDQWRWGLRFLLECRASRAAESTKRLAALGAFSLKRLRALREGLPLDYDGLARGILHLYTDKADFDNAARRAEFMSRQGIERQVVDRTACLTIEPALANATVHIVGGTYSPDDESGDAARFTKALASHCASAGVLFRFNTEALSIERKNGRARTLRCKTPEGVDSLDADAIVVAAGVGSNGLLSRVGLSMPVYPLKGYSATFKVVDPIAAPSVSLTDEGKKMVFSRLGNRYRAAGMAELVGFDKTIDYRRARLITNRVVELFGKGLDIDSADYWTGLRPATPTNVPIIGQTKVPGLYVNTGHGTLGWTLSCGSAALLEAAVEGRESPLSPLNYRL